LEGKILNTELEDMKALRSEVARLTLEIIRLSGERLAIARKIGEIKAKMNMPVEDPSIESDLRAKVIDLSRKYGLDINFALKLLDLLIDESKRVQRDLIESRLNKMRHGGS
jgi:chorismate mutase